MPTLRTTVLLGATISVIAATTVYIRRRFSPPKITIALGTKNKCKVAAVTKTLSLYHSCANATIVPRSVNTGVSEQPIGIETVASGSRNRAEAAFKAVPSTYAIGIESGLFKMGNNKHYDVCVCSIYDGTTHNLGFSCAFEIPEAIMTFVHEGMDLSEACNAAKITRDETLGENQGLIGILTKGKVTREAYTIQAVKMASLFLENATWFPPKQPVKLY